jgi:hypothetical protein
MEGGNASSPFFSTSLLNILMLLKGHKKMTSVGFECANVNLKHKHCKEVNRNDIRG